MILTGTEAPALVTCFTPQIYVVHDFVFSEFE